MKNNSNNNDLDTSKKQVNSKLSKVEIVPPKKNENLLQFKKLNKKTDDLNDELAKLLAETENDMNFMDNFNVELKNVTSLKSI